MIEIDPISDRSNNDEEAGGNLLFAVLNSDATRRNYFARQRLRIIAIVAVVSLANWIPFLYVRDLPTYTQNIEPLSMTNPFANDDSQTILDVSVADPFINDDSETASVDSVAGNFNATSSITNEILKKDNTPTSDTSYKLNSLEVLQQLENNTLDYWGVDTPKVFPVSENVFEVYSTDAMQQLRTLLATSKETMRIFANGGSATAGGGGVRYRYHHELKRLLSQTYVNTSILPEDRGHGSRDSFHTVQLAHNFLPENGSNVILIWEFAINDYQYDMKNQAMIRTNVRNQLILWLQAVERIPGPSRPLVIFVYLWKMVFTIDENGRVPNDVFDFLPDLAAEYDFCVGHVNMAQFAQELRWDYNASSKYLLADNNHPSHLMHRIIGNVLNDFIVKDHHRIRPSQSVGVPAINERTRYQWACGNRTKQHRLVQHLIENRYSKASFTHELPQNDRLFPGMLKPTTLDTSSHVFGKQDPNRQDRQQTLSLPCCGSQNETLSFTVQTMMQGLQLYLQPTKAGLTVFFDADDVTHALINTRPWDCAIGKNRNNLYQYWIVLEHERFVHSVSMCNNLCANSVNTGLMTMAVY
jgi:hypothetical protein